MLLKKHFFNLNWPTDKKSAYKKKDKTDKNNFSTARMGGCIMSDRCGVQPCCQKIQKYLLNLENINVF